LNDNPSVSMSGFFEEVKRRKVYRVAAAYVIAVGGIIQLASAAFPAWELPNWSLPLVIVLLSIGFPIALILAWGLDITSQGITATPATTAPGFHRRRNDGITAEILKIDPVRNPIGKGPRFQALIDKYGAKA